MVASLQLTTFTPTFPTLPTAPCRLLHRPAWWAPGAQASPFIPPARTSRRLPWQSKCAGGCIDKQPLSGKASPNFESKRLESGLRSRERAGSKPAEDEVTRMRRELIGALRSAQTRKAGSVAPSQPIRPCHRSKINRYLPEPTSAGNKPARALSCSAVVRFPEGCGAFWPFTTTPSYLRASMILSSAAFIEIPLSQLMAAVPLFTATSPLKNTFRIPLLVA